MSEQKFKDLKVKMKPKKVKKISLSLKQQLIESVMTDHLSIHQASKLHTINYSSAKYIINLYKKLGTVAPQQSKHRRKPKVYIVNASVLVDYNSGEILLYKQNQFKKQSQHENQQIYSNPMQQINNYDNNQKLIQIYYINAERTDHDFEINTQVTKIIRKKQFLKIN